MALAVRCADFRLLHARATLALEGGSPLGIGGATAMRVGNRYCGRCGHELRWAGRSAGGCGRAVPASADQANPQPGLPTGATAPQSARDLTASAPTLTAERAADQPEATGTPATTSEPGRPPPSGYLPTPDHRGRADWPAPRVGPPTCCRLSWCWPYLWLAGDPPSPCSPSATSTVSPPHRTTSRRVRPSPPRHPPAHPRPRLRHPRR